MYWCSVQIVLFSILITIHATDRNNSHASADIEISMANFNSKIVPYIGMNKYKGQAGKICVIGGSTEYTGAPYFAAIASLKAGADLVYVITTESAAPVIKSYSPDLIVYPYLKQKFIEKIHLLLNKMDVVVIGPGLGRENSTVTLVYEIFKFCKELKLPLVVDADGLYVISKNVYILEDYPNPGAILTPNHKEAERLKENVKLASGSESEWQRFWGDYVSVLVKGQDDVFNSRLSNVRWQISLGGSGRRAGGQGDILAGFIATFYNWALKAERYVCHTDDAEFKQFAQSIAAYAASNLTRLCNSKAYKIFGRGFVASDMVNQIHTAFAITLEY